MRMGWGLTVPLDGLSLPDHAEVIRALPGFGYTDVWSSETNGADAFTPLALAAAWEAAPPAARDVAGGYPLLRLGTAIVPVFTRGPALIAMSAAALADAAPGRFVLGLGASSPAIVQGWNGLAFEAPYRRTRDVLHVVRAALAGERVDGAFDTFTVRGFKLDRAPAVPPPVLLAALRPQMLRLAGRAADGAILNWLAATDVPRCVEAIGNPEADVVARIFVCPTEDAGYARTLARKLIATYLGVPAYAAFHDWLGRSAQLATMHERLAARDWPGARAAIPEQIVDALVVHGSPESCRAQVQAYADAGVRTPVIALLPCPETADPAGRVEVIRRLGPGSGTSG